MRVFVRRRKRPCQGLDARLQFGQVIQEGHVLSTVIAGFVKNGLVPNSPLPERTFESCREFYLRFGDILVTITRCGRGTSTLNYERSWRRLSA